MSNKPIMVIHNAETLETIEREMTDAEYADHLRLIEETAQRKAKEQADKEAAEAAKQSAQAKLAALGLTSDEVAAIVGNQPKRVACI